MNPNPDAPVDHTPLQIPVEHLHDSPFNPREVYDPADDAEMVEDIKTHGRILQPLMVRPRTTPLFGSDPESFLGYEVVFGHRRKRNGIAAGLATLPCMVEPMDDATARRMQISENLTRKNVHPLEEAKGFQALIDDDGETADTIAAKFGKSRSYVYGRLKLLGLVPELRKACLAKEVDAEVALLVARLRTPEFQHKALGYIKQEYRAKLDDGGQASYRTIRDLLNEKFTLDLDKAMFDIEDEMLVPQAGHCLRCPKRTGNAPEFEDVATAGEKAHPFSGMLKRVDQHFGHLTRTGANVCTDPDCFDAKKKAHLKREADKLVADGKVVVTGNAARSAISAHGEVKGAYIALKDVKADLKKLSAKKTVVYSDQMPKTVFIQDPRTGQAHAAVKLADLEAAGLRDAAPAESPKRNSGGYDHAAEERKRQQRDDQAQATTARNVERLKRARAALPPTPGLLELRLIAHALYEPMEDSNDSEVLHDLYADTHGRNLGSKIDHMEPAELTRLCIDCVLVSGVTATRWEPDREPHNLLAIAAAHAIDLDADKHTEQDAANAAEPAAESESTPPPAARAPKKVKAAPARAGAGAKGTKVPKAKSPAGKKKNQKDNAGGAGGSGAQVDAFAEAGVEA